VEGEGVRKKVSPERVRGRGRVGLGLWIGLG